MNLHYPSRHHPIFFLQDTLQVGGLDTTFHRDEQSRGLWGLDIDGRMVVWLIDIRWQHERDAHEQSVRQLMDDGALVMAAQKRDAEYFDCKWLPLATTPGYSLPSNGTKRVTDLAFVGYVRDEPRRRALLHLNTRHTISVCQGLFGSDAVYAYHAARLGVNIPTRYGDPLAYDVNMRVFEILATGTPLVTNWLPELEELGIIHEKTAFVYRHEQELVDIVGQALKRDDLEEIGARAAEMALQNHTYGRRAKQVMEWLSEKRGKENR